MQQKTTTSHHLVFGAGLIGCYLGGVMNVLGVNTSLVCRPSIRKKLLAGIRLTDFEGHQSSSSELTIIDSELIQQQYETTPKAKYLWLTVKCIGIGQAILDMAPFIDQDTVILCCQNGLGSDREVKLAYPNNLVLRVMVPFNVVELSSGHYHRGSEGNLTIERSQKCPEMISSLVRDLHSQLLPVSSTDDINGLLWAKLQLNLGNSVNALADIPVKAMLEQRRYRQVIAQLMKELLQVTDTLNIKLPKVTALPAHMLPWVLRLPDFIFTRVANKMLAIDPNARSSMWWDLSQGKPTEIEHLNGAVVQQGMSLNIRCTANQQISRLIKQLTEKTDVQDQMKPPVSADALWHWLTRNQL